MTNGVTCKVGWRVSSSNIAKISCSVWWKAFSGQGSSCCICWVCQVNYWWRITLAFKINVNLLTTLQNIWGVWNAKLQLSGRSLFMVLSSSKDARFLEFNFTWQQESVSTCSSLSSLSYGFLIKIKIAGHSFHTLI